MSKKPWKARATGCAATMAAFLALFWAFASTSEQIGASADGQATVFGLGEGIVAFAEGRSPGDPSLPKGFEESLFELPEHSELFVDAQAGLVGYFVDEQCDRAFAEVDEALRSAGWQRVESGVSYAASFVKEGSAVFISCTEVGGGTSVVVQAPFLANAPVSSFD